MSGKHSGPNRMLIRKFCICWSDGNMGTVPCSKTSTCVELGGSVGHQMTHVVFAVAVRLFATANDVLHGLCSTVMLYDKAARAKRSMA